MSSHTIWSAGALTLQKKSFLKQYGAPLTLAFSLMAVSLAPLASAASLPLLGEFDVGFNWAFGLILIGILAAATGIAAGRALVKRIPVAGGMLTTGGPILGILLLLTASWINPGGLLNGDDTVTIVPSAGAVSATSAAAVVGFDSARYESVSKAIFYGADAAVPSTAVNPVLSLYKPGVTEKAAMEGTGIPLYSGTLSSGTLTIDGIQVQQYGCTFDIGVDAANYYEQVVRNVNLCREKNANGLNTVSVPTIFLKKIGTASLSLTGTSLTCSAGSTCTYSVVVRNSVADTAIAGVAVKFHTATNATLDSIVSGSACELVEVSSTQYIVFQAELGSLDSKTCNVQITRASGSADGTYKLTMDDMWLVNGATAWNTNSNTRGASATSATTVTFA